MSLAHVRPHFPSYASIKLVLLETPYSITSAAIAALLAAILLILSTTACNTANKPAPPKPGTVAYSWISAEESYRQKNYQRTNEHLARLVSAQSEYRDRARLWSLIVSSGVASGYRELADAYENGARLNRAQLYDYRDRMGKARRAANQAAMMFVESFHQYLAAGKEAPLAFEFAFPQGKTAEPLQLTKLNKGITLQAADHEVLEREIVERAVVRTASQVVGGVDDLEKARTQFKQPSRELFLKTMAQSLYENADLYNPRKLDEPRRLHILCKEALEAVALLPDSKDRKQLESKIRDLMKKHPIKEA
jgi:hypothetical protein